MKNLYDLDIDINDFNKRFEAQLSKGHGFTGKQKEKYENAKLEIEDSKTQVQNWRNELKKATKDKKPEIESNVKTWQNKLKKHQAEIRKINKSRRGFEKIPNEYLTFKTSFGDQEFRISRKVLIKNLGNTSNLIKQRVNREIRKTEKKERQILTQLDKQKKPTIPQQFGDYKSEKNYRENNINIFQSIYDQIKYDPDYPMFYDYNYETGEIELHIVGFRGIKKFDREKKKRQVKYGKGHKAAPR